jgi:flagellar M-ring protein FliF
MFGFKPWNEQNPRGQVTLAVSGMIMIAAILSGLYFYLRPTYMIVFRDMRSGDAAAIVTALEQQKVPYKLTDNGGTIAVPEAVAQSTKLKLVGQDLPVKGTVGFELFNKADLGLTEFAQKINYQRALQGELARTIMSIEGIEAARVHLALPESTLFRRDAGQPTASVTLTPRGNTVLAADTIKGMQRLVAASVPNLRLNDVAIFDQHGALVSQDVEVSSKSSIYLQQKSALEVYYVQKIQKLLEPLYGPGSVSASVDVTFDNLQDDFFHSSKSEVANAELLPYQLRLDNNNSVRNNRIRGLAISVIMHVSVSELQKSEIQNMITSAVGFAPDRGDSLSIFVPKAKKLSPLRATSPEPWIAKKPMTSGSWIPLWAVITFGTIALLLVIYVVRRGRVQPVPALSDIQREERISQFRQLLAEGVDHASS